MAARSKAHLAFHPALVLMVSTLTITQLAFLNAAESAGILLALVSALAAHTLLPFLNVSESLAEAVKDISLLFIYMLLSSTLPWFFLRQDLLVPAVYSLVLALCFWRVRSKNLSPREIGLVRNRLAANCLMGVAAGIPAGVIEFFILRPPAATPMFDLLYFAKTGIHMFVFVGLAEEILFRALIQRSIIRLVGTRPGVLWGALVFSAMHIIWRSIPEVIFTFAAGLLLGLIYERTVSIVAPVFLHGTNNLVLLAVMPHLV